MKEATLVNKIGKYLKTIPNCCFEKRHGTPYGKVGQPDISCCVQDKNGKGIRLEFEAKILGNTPTPIQIERLKEWKNAGAIVGVVYSLEDVKALLKQVNMV